MLHHREREIRMGLTFSLLIPLLAFLSTSQMFDLTSLTGYAVHEGSVQGKVFTAVVDGTSYTYVFTEQGMWLESKDWQEWQYRPDMGDTLWSGLLYLKGYGARIFYEGEELTDLTAFARRMRS